METPSEIYPPFKVDVPMTDDETAFEDIEDDDAPGSSNDPHQSTPKSLNGMLNLGLHISCSRLRTTKFPNSESPIFYLLA